MKLFLVIVAAVLVAIGLFIHQPLVLWGALAALVLHILLAIFGFSSENCNCSPEEKPSSRPASDGAGTGFQ